MAETTHPSHREWANVDQSGDPQAYVRFLDASREQILAQVLKNPKAFFSYLGLEPGMALLDIGSGTGSLLHPLKPLVEPGGKVVGIDYSNVMVEEARKRAEGSGLALEFLQMDAAHLQFSDNTFDRVTSNIVFQHLPDPVIALGEAIRVAKPGAQIFINEQDWDTVVIDSGDKASTRAIVRTFSDSIKNGWIGRELYGMFVRADLRDIAVTPSTFTFMNDQWQLLRHLFEPLTQAVVANGGMTQEQADSWLREQDEKSRSGQFFAAFTLFRVSGTKC